MSGLKCFIGRHWELALFAVLFIWLVSIRIDSPWKYVHDDNGAWVSSCARTHLKMGLSVTKGQDFRMYRDKPGLWPYLHHPPFVALWTAGVFAVTDSDSTKVARAGIATLQFGTFLLFCIWATSLCKSRLGRDVAVFVFSLVPMSVFFGKMPNHEAPSLFFLMLGVLGSTLYRFGEGERKGWLLPLIFLAWGGVCFSSWAAIISIVPFIILLSLDGTFRERKRFLGVSITSVLLFLSLVLIQLAIARGGSGYGENAKEVSDYLVFRNDGKQDLAACWINSFIGMYWHGYRDFAVVPWFVFLFWLGGRIWQWLKSEPCDAKNYFVFAMTVGTMIYSCVFPNAVRVHTYHLMYILPVVALVFGWSFEVMRRGFTKGRFLSVAVVLLTLTGLMTWRRLDNIYGKKHEATAGYAVQNVKWQLQKFK